MNQFGGYTGMRPADFRRFVSDIAARVGFAAQTLWLGGDHLGPNAWRAEPAEVRDGEVGADDSRLCRAGLPQDSSRLLHGVRATMPSLCRSRRSRKRAAQLCAVAESAWREVGGEPPVYVIGTEVPVPGGATEELHELAVTTPQAASATIAAHREAFARAGLESAWSRVIALVVQPGVEFDHHKVIDYVPEQARAC